MKKDDTKVWVPEIYYEDGSEGINSQLPFIQVPPNEVMPKFLFIFETRETGEIEPGPEGEDLPVTEMTLHQYADMENLKMSLTEAEYDKVRTVLGLKPLREAIALGHKISEHVKEKNLGLN